MFIIGKVLKPQGILGEVKVEIITSFPEHFEHISEIYIEQNSFVKLEVLETRFSKGFVFIKFKEVISRNDAEALRAKYLYVPDNGLFPLQEDEYYHHQLIGMQVVDQDDIFIGTIKDIEVYPQNDMLNIESENKETFLIPVVKDFIKKVDFKSQKVTVHVIEGLLG